MHFISAGKKKRKKRHEDIGLKGKKIGKRITKITLFPQIEYIDHINQLTVTFMDILIILSQF